jgi:hypothetical protein
MKKIRGRAAALLLCGCLALGLTGCGAGNNNDTAEENSLDKEKAVSVDNGTLNDDSVAIAVGKTTVPYSEYKIYSYFMKNQYEGILEQGVWDYTVTGASQSIGQEAVEDVVRLIIQVKVIGKAAEAMGVELAADEKEEADYNAKQYCDSLSEDVKNENSISQTMLAQIFEENKLAEKMYSIVIGDISVTSDQLKAARVQLVYLAADDQNKEQVREQAQSLCEQAKALSGNFYRFARENTEKDDVEYLIGEKDSRTALASTVLAMKQYGISDVIEESDGFYIAYCVEPASDSLSEEYKNQYVEDEQVQAFQSAYADWSESYGVRVSKSLLVE